MVNDYIYKFKSNKKTLELSQGQVQELVHK
ncbi:hypothetical protein COHCIP112018_01390 [Cohnella sp. JJ-181]|nr:hypothetical protein COHCIP112018_01390 [Cohnella sp. JJ-181]